MWSELRRARRVMKRVITSGVTGGWVALFGIVGRLRRKRTPRWSSPGGRRVVAVAPHPDDEVYGCGGTLLRHVDEGDRVVVVVATDGRRSRALGRPPPETAAVRRLEASEAVAELGAELRWLGLPEGEWDSRDLVPPLTTILENVRPEIVYAPSRVDFHPEHLRVAAGISEALGRCRTSSPDLQVRIYAVQVPLTPRLANLVTPMEEQEAGWRRALERHRSQRGTLRSAKRLRRYAARLHGTGRLAEELWELSPKAYQALHPADTGWSGASHPRFRGIRPLPFTDPLAYWVGGGERRRLLSLVGIEAAADEHLPGEAEGGVPLVERERS